jgi:hypothetical protein
VNFISGIEKFPSSTPGKEYEEDFVSFINFFLKEHNLLEDIGYAGLLYGEILFRYPLTVERNLPEVLTHNVDYLINENKLNKEKITEIFYNLINIGLLQSEKVEYRDDDKTEIIYIEPGRDPNGYINYMKKFLRNVNTKKSVINEFIDHLNFWKTELLSFFKNRTDEYCYRIDNRSSKEGEEELNSVMQDVDGFEEIWLATFAGGTFWWIIENSIKKALISGVKRYKILLIHPNLGEEIETLKAKKAVIQGIKNIQNLKKTLRKETNLKKKDVDIIKLRLICKKEHIHFFGVLKIPKEDSGKKPTYLCLVRRNRIERGVNAIVLRGYHSNNTLFALMKFYLDLVWKKAIKPGPLGWLRKNWIWIFGPMIYISILMITFSFYNNITAFMLYLVSGIGLKWVYDFIRYMINKEKD